MKKFFLVLGLFVFVSFLSGCNFWWQNKHSDVSALNFYIYNQLEDGKVNAELSVTPDYAARTLAVKLMKYSNEEVDKANPGFVKTNEGVIGGSNFDDFEALLGLFDDLVPSEDASAMMAVVVEKVGGEKVTYNWGPELDEKGKKFYGFYETLSSLFAEDVY